jgi:hypothetical protein
MRSRRRRRSTERRRMGSIKPGGVSDETTHRGAKQDWESTAPSK